MEKFLTGHEIFDEIVDIYYGSALLVLDDGYGEARHFLMNLIKTQKPIRLMIGWDHSPTKEVVFVAPLTLNDVSIAINKLRRNAQKTVLIHEYLSDLLIKHEHESILKLLEIWKYEVQNNKTVEFYLLPKGTFPEIEKKILAIFDGGIEVRISQTKMTNVREFVPIKCCHPEWNLRSVKYEYRDNRVLIEWYGEMTDKLTRLSPDLVNERIKYYEENLTHLKLKINHRRLVKPVTESLWLFSHFFDDKTLLDVKLLFPEDFNNLLKKIAIWELQGYVSIVEAEEKPIKNIKQVEKERVNFKTRFALKLPSWFFFKFLNIKEGARVPGSIYNMERKFMFEFFKNILCAADAECNEKIEKFLKIKEEFHQMIGRHRALEAIQEIGENPLKKLDIKYLPKVIKLTLYFGYRLKCSVERINTNVFRIRVPACFLCKNTTSEIPVCSAITGAISGAVSVTFKEKVQVKEIKCKATGHEECVFELKIE